MEGLKSAEGGCCLIRTLTEAIPKERAGGLPVFAVALRCVPYLIPEHWEGSKLADELPGKFSISIQGKGSQMHALLGLTFRSKD
jgi:hypothetical protein